MTTNIRPLHDRVLVRRLPEAPRLDGLILIKNDASMMDVVHDGTDKHSDYRRVPLLGEVVAVGPGKYDEKNRFHRTTVKPGDVVIFTDWNDWDQAPAGLYMIREGDVWGYPKAHA